MARAAIRRMRKDGAMPTQEASACSTHLRHSLTRDRRSQSDAELSTSAAPIMLFPFGEKAQSRAERTSAIRRLWSLSEVVADAVPISLSAENNASRTQATGWQATWSASPAATSFSDA